MRINKMDQNREIKQTWNNSKRWKQHIDKINKKYNINISEIETKKMETRIPKSKNTQNDKNRNRE